MALQKNRLALIGAFVAMCSIEILLALEPKQTEKIWQIYLKLEKAVNEDINEINLDELIKASDDYASWPQNEKEGVLKMMPVRTVRDFVLAPMQKENKPTVEEIIGYYRKFQPAYKSGIRLEPFTPARTDDSTLLLLGLIASKKPLKFDDFDAARKEAVSLLGIFNSITEKGLMYDNEVDSNNFQLLLNYFNNPCYKPFFEFVFPAMNYTKDVKKLGSLYRDNAFLYGPKYVKGKCIITHQILLEPGFQYVV